MDLPEKGCIAILRLLLTCTNLAIVGVFDTVEQEVELLITASTRHLEGAANEVVVS